MPTTHHETKYALPTQRKIPIGRNRCACQSNLICSNAMTFVELIPAGMSGNALYVEIATCAF